MNPKKIISYLFPLEIYRDERIVIQFFQGKYILNGKHVNYSNHELQRAFEAFFSRYPLDYNTLDQVLLLGFGFGSVANHMHKRNPNAQITAIELNPTTVDWYRKLYPESKVHLLLGNAENADLYANKPYDLVVVDVFDEDKIPEGILEVPFWETLFSLLSPVGTIVFNTMTVNKVATKYPQIAALFQQKIETMSGNIFFVNTVRPSK